MGFADGFISGLQTGTSIWDSLERRDRARQEFAWKKQDREFALKERQRLEEKRAIEEAAQFFSGVLTDEKGKVNPDRLADPTVLQTVNDYLAQNPLVQKYLGAAITPGTQAEANGATRAITALAPGVRPDGKPDPSKVTPIVSHVTPDGKVLSTGPMTARGSSDPNDPVVQVPLSDAARGAIQRLMGLSASFREEIANARQEREKARSAFDVLRGVADQTYSPTTITTTRVAPGRQTAVAAAGSTGASAKLPAQVQDAPADGVGEPVDPTPASYVEERFRTGFDRRKAAQRAARGGTGASGAAPTAADRQPDKYPTVRALHDRVRSIKEELNKAELTKDIDPGAYAAKVQSLQEDLAKAEAQYNTERSYFERVARAEQARAPEQKPLKTAKDIDAEIDRLRRVYREAKKKPQGAVFRVWRWLSGTSPDGEPDEILNKIADLRAAKKALGKKGKSAPPTPTVPDPKAVKPKEVEAAIQEGAPKNKPSKAQARVAVARVKSVVRGYKRPDDKFLKALSTAVAAGSMTMGDAVNTVYKLAGGDPLDRELKIAQIDAQRASAEASRARAYAASTPASGASIKSRKELYNTYKAREELAAKQAAQMGAILGNGDPDRSREEAGRVRQYLESSRIDPIVLEQNPQLREGLIGQRLVERAQSPAMTKIGETGVKFNTAEFGILASQLGLHREQANAFYENVWRPVEEALANDRDFQEMGLPITEQRVANAVRAVLQRGGRLNEVDPQVIQQVLTELKAARGVAR